jgi:hypothetical protein
MVLLHAVFFWHARHLIAQRYADFTAFYAAGLMVREGMGHEIYDLPLQAQVEREQIGRSAEIAALPFLRPAYEALAFLPLSFLPYLGAFTLWNVLSVIFLCLWVWLARGRLPALQEFSPALWLLALVAFFPVFINLPMGQDSIAFLLLVTLAFFKLRNREEFLAGVWLGFAAFKPQIVLPLVLILMFRPQRGRLLSGFLAAAIATVLISVAVSGWYSVLHYPIYLLNVNRELGSGTITPLDMPNLRGLTAWLGIDGLGAGTASLLIVAVAGITNLRKQIDFDSAFSISIAAALLAGYHTHIYDLALLVLPIALRLNFLLEEGEFRQYAPELGLLGLLVLSPLYLLLIRHQTANLLALPLLLFILLIAFSPRPSAAATSIAAL